MKPAISEPSLDEGIIADLEFFAANRPPAIQMSFNGLDEPQLLWNELTELGWNIPPCPPRPSSAIEWVPDPTTGNDYTVHNWRVKEFKIGPGNWTEEQAASVGSETVAVLRRHGVAVTGIPDEPEIQSPPALPESATVPDQHAQVVLVDQEDLQAATSLDPSFDSWAAISGREKTPHRWNESPKEAASLFGDHAALQSLSDSGAHAWVIESPLPPAPASSAVTIRMILLGTAATDKKVTKLTKLLTELVVVPLKPIVPGTEPSVLIGATVGANEADVLLSNLRLRFPRAVLRVER